MKKVFKRFIGLLVFLSVYIVQARTVRFGSKYSTIKINGNAELQIDQPIDNFSGRLQKDELGALTGEAITFLDGVFQEVGQDINFSSIYRPDLFAIVLDGDKEFYAGTSEIRQVVLVSGTGNKITGDPLFANDIILADANTELTVSISSPVTRNINLNGGTLILDGHLRFEGNKSVIGPGEICANGYTLSTSHEPLDLSDDITFNFSGVKGKQLPGNSGSIDLHSCVTTISGNSRVQGNAYIRGYGAVLQLDPMGTLEFRPNANVTIADVVIKGLGNGSSFIVDSTATVQFSNVVFELDNNFTFSAGTFTFKGPSTIIMKDHTFTFGASTTVTVDGVTVWKDPAAQENTPGDVVVGGISNLINDGRFAFIGSGGAAGGVPSLIEILESCCQEHDSRLDIVESCIDDLKLNGGGGGDPTLPSRVEILETCCQVHDSRLDVADSCLEVVKSEVDVHDSRIDLVESCCDAHDSLLDIQSTLININTSCCDAQDSRLNVHDSRLDVADSCLEVVKSEVDVHDSRIESLETFRETLIEMQFSLPDTVFSCIDELKSTTDNHETRIVDLESCCEHLHSWAHTAMMYIDQNTSYVDQLHSCCEEHDSRLDLLEECCGGEGIAYPCDKAIDLFEDTNITPALIPHESQTIIITLHGINVCFDGEVSNGSGCIALEKNARLIFKGTGSVEFKNNMFFDASEGNIQFLDSVSLRVDNCSQLITDRSQVRFDFFKAIIRKIKQRYSVIDGVEQSYEEKEGIKHEVSQIQQEVVESCSSEKDGVVSQEYVLYKEESFAKEQCTQKSDEESDESIDENRESNGNGFKEADSTIVVYDNESNVCVTQPEVIEDFVKEDIPLFAARPKPTIKDSERRLNERYTPEILYAAKQENEESFVIDYSYYMSQGNQTRKDLSSVLAYEKLL